MQFDQHRCNINGSCELVTCDICQVSWNGSHFCHKMHFDKTNVFGQMPHLWSSKFRLFTPWCRPCCQVRTFFVCARSLTFPLPQYKTPYPPQSHSGFHITLVRTAHPNRSWWGRYQHSLWRQPLCLYTTHMLPLAVPTRGPLGGGIQWNENVHWNIR
jgi:hypothetical protein